MIPIDSNDILLAKILIVDDQLVNVHLLEQLLRDAGYTNVTSTTDSKLVCSLHRKNNYDLILLDLQMPEMDGFQVMSALNTNIETDYLPVIVLTAQPGHKLQALRAGARDFISKPFDLVEAKLRIRNTVEVRLLYKLLQNSNEQLENIIQERTAELRESEARYRSLMELASDWYWEQDADGELTKVSGPVQEMLGIQVGSFSETAGAHQTEGWNAEEQRELQMLVEARQPFLDFSLSRINPDGGLEYFRISGEPIFNPASRFLGYRGIGVKTREHK